MNISYIKAAESGVLTAEAREVARGRKTGNYDVRVYDESGDVIAVFQGLVYIKKYEYPPKP